MNTIHITTQGFPLETVPRRIGFFNAGLYCASCRNFISFGVHERLPASGLRFTADAAIDVLCPYCNRLDQRQAPDIVVMRLTETNKRVSSPQPTHDRGDQ
jgi:hypothetical protein